MTECEHKFGIKKRNETEYYCPVCRSIVDKESLDKTLKQGEGWWVNSDKVGAIKKI